MPSKANLRKTKPLLVRFSEHQREQLARAIELESERRGEIVSAQSLIRELVTKGIERLFADHVPVSSQ